MSNLVLIVGLAILVFIYYVFNNTVKMLGGGSAEISYYCEDCRSEGSELSQRNNNNNLACAWSSSKWENRKGNPSTSITVYSGQDFTGKSVTLPVGDYDTEALIAKGIPYGSIMSVKVDGKQTSSAQMQNSMSGGYNATIPVIGGQLFSRGGQVTVTMLQPNTELTSKLWLLEPEKKLIGDTKTDQYKILTIGPYPAGVELLFAINVGGSNSWFKMGPGERNPDGLPHAQVSFVDKDVAVVGFKSVFNNSQDRNYNDVRVTFRGVAPGPKQSVDIGTSTPSVANVPSIVPSSSVNPFLSSVPSINVPFGIQVVNIQETTVPGVATPSTSYVPVQAPSTPVVSSVPVVSTKDPGAGVVSRCYQGPGQPQGQPQGQGQGQPQGQGQREECNNWLGAFGLTCPKKLATPAPQVKPPPFVPQPALVPTKTRTPSVTPTRVSMSTPTRVSMSTPKVVTRPSVNTRPNKGFGNGTQGDPFTDIEVATMVQGKGVYWFKIGGQTFSTIVDNSSGNGWVLMASGSGRKRPKYQNKWLPYEVTTNLRHQTDQILPETAFTANEKIRYVRISGKAIKTDEIVNGYTDHVGAVRSVTAGLSISLPKGQHWVVVDGNPNRFLLGEVRQRRSGKLAEFIFQTTGNVNGIHWMPGLGFEQLDVKSSESLADLDLWVSGKRVILEGEEKSMRVGNNVKVDGNSNRQVETFSGRFW